MSAYALPGLFPPIEGLSLYSTNNENSAKSCSSEASSSSCAPSHSSPSVPLHQKHSPSSRINVLGDAVKKSVDKLSYMLISGETIPPSGVTNDSSEDGPGIAVKEAKIDPVRLVQCVTSAPQRKIQGKTLRRRGSREGGLDLCAQNKPKDPNNNPHDEAIEFELSISFNGRKYTATRTLQCIIQLRNDLVREMNTRLHQCTAPLHTTTTSRTRTTTTTTSEQKDQPQQHVFEIPEIPPLDGDHSDNRSFVGRGFSMLHAMATSYVPVMECWLRNVLAIVPKDSECLINFLWEPMDDMPALESAFPSSPSMSGLDSIRELDYNTGDDDDSDDEWEG